MEDSFWLNEHYYFNKNYFIIKWIHCYNEVKICLKDAETCQMDGFNLLSLTKWENESGTGGGT